MDDLLLLSMMLGSPKYGYQLKREAAWIVGQEVLHSNVVYPMLRRFLEHGWVRKRAVPGQRGQTRQQYAMTADGRRWLFGRLTTFAEDEAASSGAFRLRVGLFEWLPLETRETVLSLREKYLNTQNQKLALLQANLELGRFGAEVVRHMRKQLEMECTWIRRLQRMAKTVPRKEG
jgi:DNA-binding PadR family transcriptional regulator